MENKYYTPSLEEFHIGFEYERFVPRSSATEEECWEKLQMSVNFLTLDEIDDEILEKEIRVKYLDTQDIEELGFICKEWELNSKFIKCSKQIDNTWWCNLWLNKDSREIHIDKCAGSTTTLLSNRIFEGTIKNYNELKRVLIQTGVIDETIGR